MMGYGGSHAYAPCHDPALALGSPDDDFDIDAREDVAKPPVLQPRPAAVVDVTMEPVAAAAELGAATPCILPASKQTSELPS